MSACEGGASVQSLGGRLGCLGCGVGGLVLGRWVFGACISRQLRLAAMVTMQRHITCNEYLQVLLAHTDSSSLTRPWSCYVEIFETSQVLGGPFPKIRGSRAGHPARWRRGQGFMCKSALSASRQRNVDRSPEQTSFWHMTYLDIDWSSSQFHTVVSASCGNRPPCAESARAN